MSRQIRFGGWLRLVSACLFACGYAAGPDNLQAFAIPIQTETAPGFDTCFAPSTDNMSVWWTNSPYYWAGIYIGGVNAACPPGPRNPNLSNAWIATVQNQGWDLAPIYVGLQSPCPVPQDVGRFSTFSLDPQPAWNQGVNAANDAINQYANALQLGAPPTWPTLIYFDLEGFAYTGPGTACATATINFLGGWTAMLHSMGAVSGVYGSAASTIKIMVDYLNTSFAQNVPDDVWVAGGGFWASSYSASATVYGNSYVADTYWFNRQRLYQYTGTHNETYGGVTISIDSDCGDGQVIGSQAAFIANGCGSPYR